ncbi:MAG: hypothetical protein CVU39_14695, partial [Chloroflexi bacterium HGW-Chloroflexi-10]
MKDGVCRPPNGWEGGIRKNGIRNWEIGSRRKVYRWKQKIGVILGPFAATGSYVGVDVGVGADVGVLVGVNVGVGSNVGVLVGVNVGVG